MLLWLLFNKMGFNSEAAVLEAFPLCSWPPRPSRCPGDTMTSGNTMTSSAKKRKNVRATAAVFEIHLRKRNVSALLNHPISFVVESPRSIVMIMILFPCTCTFVMDIHADVKPTSQTETHLPQPPTDPAPALNEGKPIQRPR